MKYYIKDPTIKGSPIKLFDSKDHAVRLFEEWFRENRYELRTIFNTSC